MILKVSDVNRSHGRTEQREGSDVRIMDVSQRVKLTLYEVGPGLAQLVERLTHRYSKSTSSNPGNLTSATVCGDRTGLAVMPPEVDLGECKLHLPLQKANKAAHSGFKTQRRCHQKSKTGCTSGPEKDMCVRQKLFLKNNPIWTSVC